MKRYKHSRTPHLPCSLSRTSDDKTLSDYSIFEGQEVVATVKMDGENTVCYSDGYCHARSIDSQNHPSRDYVKRWWGSKFYLLPAGSRIVGENVYAKHSIFYSDLEAYFYLFGAIDNNNCYVNWDDTKRVADTLGCPVPREIYRGPFSLEVISRLSSITETEEGFVLRNVRGFPFEEFSLNCGKMVRENHVQTNKHWSTQEIIPNKLCQK